MNAAKVIIFDFDGTIADTSSLIRGIYNEMAAENGWPTIDEKEYQRLRGLGFVKAQKWSGIKSWQIPSLMREGLKRFHRHTHEIELFKGMPELISRLADNGKIIYILSTNNPQIIKEVLGRYGISDKVKILKRSALFSKHYPIRHLVTKHKYKPENVWMVGDEVRDIEAAKRAGVKGVAVNWGLQTKDLLDAAGSLATVATANELFAVIKD